MHGWREEEPATDGEEGTTQDLCRGRIIEMRQPGPCGHQPSKYWMVPTLDCMTPSLQKRGFCHLQTKRKPCTGPSHLISSYLSVLVFKNESHGSNSIRLLHKQPGSAEHRAGKPTGVHGTCEPAVGWNSLNMDPKRQTEELATICSPVLCIIIL